MEQPRKRSSTRSCKSNDNDKKTKDLNNVSKLWQELTYDVLRIIFQYLNGLDLSNAARVCRSWLEAANNEKRTRGPMCLMREESKTEVPITNWGNLIKESIQCSMVKPSLSLSFIAGHGIPFSERCHCNSLPSNCGSILVNTYGVVINNSEKTENNGNYLVCMFLPDVSNIKVSTILFDLYDWETTLRNYCKQLTLAFKSSVNDNRKAICAMVFCDWSGRHIALNLLKYSKSWLPKTKSCIWGGITKSLTVCTTVNNTRVCKSNSNCISVILIGTKMRNFSILLDANCNTKEKVEKSLKTFKDSVKLRKHSMGFMFACCIRGVKMFKEYNVESTAFKQLFPNVPLVGCFGDGEFGANILSETPTNGHIKWYNSVSTAFMILTYD